MAGGEKSSEKKKKKKKNPIYIAEVLLLQAVDQQNKVWATVV